MQPRRLTGGLTGLLLLLLSAAAGAQTHVHVEVHPGHPGHPGVPGVPGAHGRYIIVPQSRVMIVPPAPPSPRVPIPPPVVQVTGVDVNVSIVGQTATTIMDIHLRNPSNQRLEAEMLVPVPDRAVVRGLTFQGGASEPKAELLPRDVARRIYDEIVGRSRDPALLEFAGYNLIRSSVFPVEPHGTQQVRLTYENLLPAEGNRIDYVLPRSESLDYRVPWTIRVQLRSERPIVTLYSPSHEIAAEHTAPHTASLKLSTTTMNEPGPFRLSYMTGGEGVSASLMAYPDPKVGGGYFLLLAGLPPLSPAQQKLMKREVTLVIDRSGSMNGQKMKQVREAVLQVISGLDDGEAFNLIVYNEAVELFSRQPVIKNEQTLAAARAFIQGTQPRGGTNIHDALVEALRQQPTPNMLPIVLFLTDGLPTIGQTSEVAIRDMVPRANVHHRRIFTFGVGEDVNTPLLEKIADLTRATATFVLPREDIEVKVAQVFRRLAGPVLADPVLEVVSAGRPAHGRVRDLVPSRLPDVFDGDQLVLLGQYIGEQPLELIVSGNYLGQQRAFRFSFPLDQATTLNAFVPRLWASRKIALLVQAIRDMGADSGAIPGNGGAPSNPRIHELVQEIIRLSTEFGILTEYTAFLAREGTDLTRTEALGRAVRNFDERAIRTRAGMAGINQESNTMYMKEQRVLNRDNRYLDESMREVTVSNVQQINDRTFYQRGGQWVDAQLMQRQSAQPARVIEPGSPEHQQLVDRLVRENRNGSLSLPGDKLMLVGEEAVLVK